MARRTGRRPKVVRCQACSAAAAKANPGRRSTATPEIDEYLVATHATTLLKDQAQHLGRAASWVQLQRRRLHQEGRIDLAKGAYHRPWTEAEEKYLAARIGKEPLEAIAKAMGRSVTSLRVHRKRTKFVDVGTQRANIEGLSATQVAKILDPEGDGRRLDVHTIVRWIRKGQLKASRIPWIRAGGHSTMWIIRREDLVEFLLDVPWEYDRERIADPFFRRVADEAWKRDPLLTPAECARELGLKNESAYRHLVAITLPKFMKRSELVIRRRGTVREGFRGGAGNLMFTPRSTLERIKRCGWVNAYRVARDPNWLTADRAVKLVLEQPGVDAPTATRSGIRWRMIRFYKAGVIPTRTVRIAHRQPWLVARPADVLAAKDALVAPAHAVLRLTPYRRGLIERHDPSWLERPRDLALALADGRMEQLLLRWRWDDRVAAFELRQAKAKRWALITIHVARTLRALGPKTKYKAAKRIAVYHTTACRPGLERIPLAEAKRRGLAECEWCAFARKHKPRRASGPAVLECASCGRTYARSVGRPRKVPTCPKCVAAASRPQRRAA